MMTGDVQEHLLALHKKLEFVRGNEMAAKSAAMHDIAPELERLRAKAVTKSRDLLMARSGRHLAPR
jgi:predicted Holliday junction resolvase-like endonuclease